MKALGTQEVDLPGAERFLLEHASELGVCGVWFVRSLWTQASEQAYQQSLQLLDYAHRYGPHRLERACELAFLYRVQGVPALQLILAEQLDRLPLPMDDDTMEQLYLPFGDSP